MACGMPQTPSGPGCIAPPRLPSPWPRMLMNAWRSSASAMARRMSGLLKGGAVKLISSPTDSLVGAISQTACGACFWRSASKGTETSLGKVMSNLPATNASSAVERLGMIWYSIPSRYGRFGFQ